MVLYVLELPRGLALELLAIANLVTAHDALYYHNNDAYCASLTLKEALALAKANRPIDAQDLIKRIKRATQ